MIPGGRRAPATGSTSRGFHADASGERTSLAPEATQRATRVSSTLVARTLPEPRHANSGPRKWRNDAGKVVARDGIEPSTRGFSIQRRARFGASKPKTGNEFPRGRPNRPARPSLFRTPNGDGQPNLVAVPCRSTACGHRDRNLSELNAGALRPAPAALDHYGWQRHCRGLFELPIAA